MKRNHTMMQFFEWHVAADGSTGNGWLMLPPS